MAALTPAEALARIGTAALLDTRDPADFERGHVGGSGHLPSHEIEARRHELPPRDVAVLVVDVDGDAAQGAAARLEALGYARTDWLAAPVTALAGAGWDRSPPVPLWRPSPWLVRCIADIPRGRALDLAAGAGREAVFLAMHGFEVEAVDHAPEALARARDLAARHAVSITTRTQDLEARDATLDSEGYALVTVFRFLHRPLLPAIAGALAPGGHLVYETFMRGQERYGRPTHPRFLFWPGELERSFAELEVLEAESSDPPGGPVMTRLHARRPA